MCCLTIRSLIVVTFNRSHATLSTTSSYRAFQPVPRHLPLPKRCNAIEALLHLRYLDATVSQRLPYSLLESQRGHSLVSLVYVECSSQVVMNRNLFLYDVLGFFNTH